MSVSVCLCACTCMYIHACFSACETRVILSVFLSLFPQFLRQGVLLNLELTDLTMLASHPDLGVILPPFAPCWDYRHYLTHLNFICVSN